MDLKKVVLPGEWIVKCGLYNQWLRGSCAALFLMPGLQSMEIIPYRLPDHPIASIDHELLKESKMYQGYLDAHRQVEESAIKAAIESGEQTKELPRERKIELCAQLLDQRMQPVREKRADLIYGRLLSGERDSRVGTEGNVLEWVCGEPSSWAMIEKMLRSYATYKNSSKQLTQALHETLGSSAEYRLFDLLVLSMYMLVPGPLVSSIIEKMADCILQDPQTNLRNDEFFSAIHTFSPSKKIDSCVLWTNRSGKGFMLGDCVHALDFTKSDNTLAAAGSNNRVFLINLDTQTTTQTPQRVLHHNDVVREIAFSPDDKKIASCSCDQTVRIWDTATGKLLHTLVHDDVIGSCCWNREGTLVGACDWGNNAKLWDASRGVCLFSFGHKGPVRKILFSPSGSLVATGSADGTCKLWDAITGKLTKALDHGQSVLTLAFNPQETLLVTGGHRGVLKLWDLKNGSLLHQFPLKPYSILHTSFDPSGSLLAAATQKNAFVWDPATLAMKAEVVFGAGTSHVSFNPDGKSLAISSTDKEIKVITADTFKLIGTLHHSALVQMVRFNHEGRRLASASWDTTAKIWGSTKELTLEQSLLYHLFLKTGVKLDLPPFQSPFNAILQTFDEETRLYLEEVLNRPKFFSTSEHKKSAIISAFNYLPSLVKKKLTKKRNKAEQQ